MIVFVAAAVLIEAAPLDPERRAATSAALAVMIPWYFLFGRPLMRLDPETWPRVAASWRGPAYLSGMIVLFAVAMYANTNAWFLAFSFSPQCFQVTTPMRRSMAFVIAFNVVAGAMFILAGHSVGNIAAAVGTVLFAIAFTQVFSRWTARVVEQSHERSALIAQLESAQAELAAANHQAGVLAERQRLAAEIHDTLAQGFLSIVTLIQAAEAADRGPTAPAAPAAESVPAVVPGPAAGDPARELLDLALDTARENLAEARALVAALAPASLDDGGLAGALSRATEATGKATGIEATCVAAGDARPLSTTSEVVLLRVCQEALANVRKHAAATRVEVRLRYTAAAVELSVADNGRGFTAPAAALAGAARSGDPARLAGVADSGGAPGAAEPSGRAGPAAGPPGTGFGLRGMRERLRQAGGTLTVTSAPGAGTTVRAEIPG